MSCVYPGSLLFLRMKILSQNDVGPENRNFGSEEIEEKESLHAGKYLLQE